MNGKETARDCGGDCKPCAVNAACLVPGDCYSMRCANKKCVAATCNDNLQDQGETDVDCGGTHCPGCPVNGACASGTDCQSGVCQSLLCVPTSASGIALPRSHWTTSSSSTNGWATVQAIDGDLATRWSYGAVQAPGMTFTLDLGQPQYLFSITMDSTDLPNDAAAGFDLYFSLDGTFGKAARSVVGAPKATVTFTTAVVTRYIRFELNQNTTTWWSIQELGVIQ